MQGKPAPAHPLWLCTSRDTSQRLYLSSPGPVHHTECTAALSSCFSPWHSSTASPVTNHKKNTLTSSLAWKRYSLPSVNLERKHHHKFISVVATVLQLLLVWLQHMSSPRHTGLHCQMPPTTCSHARSSSGLWTCSGWCLCSLLAQYLLFQVQFSPLQNTLAKFTQYFQKKNVTGSTQSFHGSCEILQNCAAALVVLPRGSALSISDEQLPLLTVKARVSLLCDSCADFTQVV